MKQRKGSFSSDRPNGRQAARLFHNHAVSRRPFPVFMTRFRVHKPNPARLDISRASPCEATAGVKPPSSPLET